ncbi:MAG: DoxX family protein [Microbacteriaceae bacterium]
MIRHIARWTLALGLAVMGVFHFTQTRGFRGLIPEWAKKATGLDEDGIVIASGAAELGLAAGLVALPKDRPRVGWATAAFFVAVFPGNVQQWRRRWSAPGLDTDTKRFVRLFLQPVLIAWALWSTSPHRDSHSR